MAQHKIPMSQRDALNAAISTAQTKLSASKTQLDASREDRRAARAALRLLDEAEAAALAPRPFSRAAAELANKRAAVVHSTAAEIHWTNTQALQVAKQAIKLARRDARLNTLARLISLADRLIDRIAGTTNVTELAAVLNNWDEGAARGRHLHAWSLGGMSAAEAHPCALDIIDADALPAWGDEPDEIEGVYSYDEEAVLLREAGGVQVNTNWGPGPARLRTMGSAWCTETHEEYSEDDVDGDLGAELLRDMHRDLACLTYSRPVCHQPR